MQEIFVVKYLIAVRLNGLSSCAVGDSSKQTSNKTTQTSQYGRWREIEI